MSLTLNDTNLASGVNNSTTNGTGTIFRVQWNYTLHIVPQYATPHIETSKEDYDEDSHYGHLFLEIFLILYGLAILSSFVFWAHYRCTSKITNQGESQDKQNLEKGTEEELSEFSWDDDNLTEVIDIDSD